MNKVIIITGATSGIGKYTALELAKKGFSIVMVARNADKAKKVKQKIIKKTGNKKIDSILCDLSSIKDVMKASEEIKKKYNRIDALINNAGVIFQHRKESVDGYEMTFAANHLGHFLLTIELLDLICNTQNARIINVSSDAHHMAKIDFDDLMAENSYNAMQAYANSKLFNIYFTNELAKRLSQKHITVNSLHPGMVRTNFGKEINGRMKLLFLIYKPFAISASKGSSTTVYLASSKNVSGITGKYFKNNQVSEISLLAQNEEYASMLWDISKKLVNDFKKSSSGYR